MEEIREKVNSQYDELKLQDDFIAEDTDEKNSGRKLKITLKKEESGCYSWLMKYLKT